MPLLHGAHVLTRGPVLTEVRSLRVRNHPVELGSNAGSNGPDHSTRQANGGGPGGLRTAARSGPATYHLAETDVDCVDPDARRQLTAAFRRRYGS